MKKALAFLLAFAMLGAVAAYASSEASASNETAASDEVEVDAYTSASLTKTTLADDALTDAAAFLAAHCSDLATLAESEADGYEAPADALNAQIMTVNPDGCVGLSTISEWQYVPSSEGDDQVMLKLTDGQNAQNLCEEGARGTLLVQSDGMSYLIHLDVTGYTEKPYTDAAYEAGEFASHYSGADNALSEFAITCRVLSIETSEMLIFG